MSKDEILDIDQREYAPAAKELLRDLDLRVESIYQQVQQSRIWRHLVDPETPREILQAIMREVFLSIYAYQPHTTEAGFLMLGRWPKGDLAPLKSMLLHKWEEAEHGSWARRDYLAMGGEKIRVDSTAASPATFAVAAVWWRMATVEDPIGYLGAEYLFEYLTVKVTRPLVEVFKRRQFPLEGAQFIVEHATEDIKHTNLLRHLVCEAATQHPQSRQAILRCFDYFRQVYPLPVWDEALDRAIKP